MTHQATLFYWEIEDGEVTFVQGRPTNATRGEIEAAAQADGAELHIRPDGH